MSRFAAMRLGLSVAALFALSVASVHAGAEIHVSVVTNFDQQTPQVACLADGTIACVWQDESSADPDILVRLFANNGVPAGPPQRVNVITNAIQADPAVAPLAGGGFVVVFSSRGFGGSGYATAFRRYDAGGNALDAQELQANVTMAGSQFKPQVAPLASGGFVVAFAGNDGADREEDVFYRRFDALGNALDAVDVAANALGNNGVVLGDQASPAVAGLADGGFVVVYADRSSDRVYGVRINAAGAAVDAPGAPTGNAQFLLDPGSSDVQSEPAVAALQGGGFAVAFNSETNGLPLSRRVLACVYGSNGVAQAAFQVGAHSNRWQDARLVGVVSSAFVVCWQVVGEGVDATNGDWSVFTQRFGTNESARSAAFMVNLNNANDQDRPSVASFAGAPTIAWESFGQDGSGYGVFMRTLDAPWPYTGWLSIQKVTPPPAPSAQLNFTGQPWEIYTLEGSSNLLVQGGWFPILTTNSSSGLFDYLDPAASGSDRQRFYRVTRDP